MYTEREMEMFAERAASWSVGPGREEHSFRARQLKACNAGMVRIPSTPMDREALEAMAGGLCSLPAGIVEKALFQ